ncbi:MAG: NB-ARC domain-containing protein [Cyclobacteriaceae bacterium]
MDAYIKNQFNHSTLNNPVFNYGERKIYKHLGSLSFPPDVFLGREDDLKMVHKKLFGKEHIPLLINGEGGIGKTTFASKYYYQNVDNYTHMAWVFAEKGLAEALLILADPLQINFDKSMTTEVRLHILLKAMAELEKPCLLVLDNANGFEDLNSNYPALRSCPNFHVLLTTRITKLSNAAIHPLGVLDRKVAIELFCRHYEAHDPSEDEILNQMLIAVGYNTLVIELLSKNISHYNTLLEKRYTLSQLLKDLTEKGLFGIKSHKVLTAYQARNLNMRKESPEDILSVMYDLSKLEINERKILSLFSVLPPETIKYDILKEILTNQDDLDKILLCLSEKGWLEFNKEESAFKISPLVQEVVRKKNQDNLWEDCQPLIKIFKHKLDNNPETGSLINTKYIDAKEWAAYAGFSLKILFPLFISHLPQEDDVVWLYDMLGTFHKTTTSHLHKALEYLQSSNNLFDQLKDKFPSSNSIKRGFSISHARLGNIYNMLGNYIKAREHISQSVILMQKLCESFPTDPNFKDSLAISYSQLGDTNISLGKLDLALSNYEEYKALRKELHKNYPYEKRMTHGLAVAYSKMGEIYSLKGKLDIALRYFAKDYSLTEDLYQKTSKNPMYKKGFALSSESMGIFYGKLGNPQKAFGYLKNLHRLAKELYQDEPHIVDLKNIYAQSFQHLGENLRSFGKHKKALEFYEKYNCLEQELYNENPHIVLFKNNLVNSFMFLGWYYENHFKKNEKAQINYLQARDLFAELHADFPDTLEYKNRLESAENALKRVELPL